MTPLARRAVAIAAVLLAIALSLLALPTVHWQKHVDYLQEQFATTNMYDTSQQQLAQQVWVLMIVASCAFILLRPRR